MANYVDATSQTVPNYVHKGTQTIWAGLAKGPSVRPDILFSAPDYTTTPPDDMITGKSQTLNRLPSVVQPLHARRPNRPVPITRISLPSSELDDEVFPSPPPTQAMLSPLPAANRLHAGHTPLAPRALSPVRGDEAQLVQRGEVEENRPLDPEDDMGLTGPLVLPTNPVDGAEDCIALDALDDELSRVAREQERLNKLQDVPEPAQTDMTEEGLPLSRKGSADSRDFSEDVEVVDGVRLKSPRLNFGAPFGQAFRRRSESDTPAA